MTLENLEQLEHFGEALISTELIDEEKWEKLKEEYQTSGKSIEEIILRDKLIPEEELGQLLELFYGVPHLKLSECILEREAMDLLPDQNFCMENKIVPVNLQNNVLTIAISNPYNTILIGKIKDLAKKELNIVHSTGDDILRTINIYYSSKTTLDAGLKRLAEKNILDLGDEAGLKRLSQEAPVINLVNEILIQAIQSKASDIHIEPTHNELLIRFRIDGVLRVFLNLPISLHAALISRVKILAGMDITERRLPQDGRTEIRIRGNLIDLRINTLPLIHGEKIVIRILDKKTGVRTLDKIGFCKENLARIKKAIEQTYGMMIICGPTGSGKSSTCYSICSQLRSIEKNLVTVEDTVEYQMDLVNQVQIHQKVGLNFATSLRAILRQDPDIILIGEVRDLETAEMAIHSALTGHLVLCTFHTNDAPTALTRLVDMGIPPFLVASAVRAIIAQRLIRVICPNCKEERELKTNEWEAVFGMAYLSPAKVFEGKGCPACHNTGYAGRAAISEVLLISDKVRQVFTTHADSASLIKVGKEEGMITLMDDAMMKVAQGVTNLREVTLIETLIAMYLLLICVFFIISVFPASTLTNKSMENLILASTLARNKLEGLRAMNFDSILSFSGTSIYSGIKNGVNYTQDFSYNITVSSLNSNLKDILITVTWEESKMNKNFKLESLQVKL
ncbi:MAG: Flp pilus assembly complex ATPase component TadA [Armatimonadetes bacterium]|nr:Flp pilus assembly complex ATPase component TadA [Armatimonadota bacterium]